MLVAPTSAVSDLVRAGRVAEALRMLEELGTRVTPPLTALTLTLTCRLARGEVDLALDLGERIAAHPDPDSGRGAVALGELAAATGRDEDAVEQLLRAGRLLRGDADDTVELPWRAAAAVSLVRLGRTEEAQQLARDHLALARAQRSAYAVAGAMRTVAAVCPGGRTDEQLRHARLLLGETHLLLAATIDTDLAGLLALMGGPAGREEAVTLLRSAEAYADLEDLWPLHGRVRRLLERLGQPSRTLRCEAIARLSEVELHIACLAARGATNRRIAETEQLTVKAVEWYLSRAYRKLGIRGRRELAHSLKLG